MSLSRARRSGTKQDNSLKKTRSLTDATGLPGPVQSLTGSAINNNQINISWSAPVVSGDSSITGYSVTTTPSAGSVSISGTSASATGLSTNTTYTFTVRAQNSVGSGIPVTSASVTTTNFNSATGGTITTVSNYNGSGETWKVHRFTSGGTFGIVDSATNFRYMVVGGGAGGPSEYGAATRGGTVAQSTTWQPTAGNKSVSIGNGAGGCCRPGDWQTGCTGGAGGSSTLQSAVTASGGSTSNSGSNVTSNISGSNVTYGQGNGGSTYGSAGGRGIACGGPGRAGVVYVSYEAP